MQPSRKIADLVQVRRHPTVVRLEDAARGDADWIEEAYLLTDEVRRHLQGLRHALARDTGTGVFLIGHYGAGKSHFLAYLERRLRHAERPGPVPLALSLLNFRAETPLEDIVSGALGLDAGGADRRTQWEAVDRDHPRGLLLMLDELSEFLRAKPTPQAFHEDIRYLQFLGEWTQGHRLWVLAAMQEQIEHTGELEYGLYKKIKDRYPLRLLLTPAHVRELLADSILHKAEGYAPAVERLALELREAFPDSRVDFADLTHIYPLHPATLALLEEVRDRFSSARGVVDFAVNQLLGNPERGIEPFLERPWGSLLTPDYIVDHFRDLLEVQSEYLPLAQRLFPHYRRQMAELFPQAARQELAWRLLKLLVLVHLSPEREVLDPRQAAAWLLYRVTRVDPRRNLDLVHKTLEQLATGGRYVTRRGAGFRLDLADDSGAALDRLLQRELAELPPTPAAVMEAIVPHLGEDAFNPFTLPRDRWQPRTLTWRFHPRDYAVYLGEGPPPEPPPGLALWLRLPWSEPTAAPVPGSWTLQPATVRVGEDLRELAALLRLAGRVLAPEVAQRVARRVQERLDTVRQQLARAYRDAVLLDPEGRRESGFGEPGPRPFKAWLEACALWLLRRRYPAFERFAPSQGPLPREAYRQFFRAVQVLGLDQPRSPQAGEFLDLVREGYLVPMGLLRHQGPGYQVPARLEGHELVKLVRPLLAHQPAPDTLYRHLAQPVYGLVPDQVQLLLLFLLIQGEVDLLKGGRSYRELYETLSLPAEYERVVPAQALGVDELKALEQLCEGLRLRTPGQWTVLAQRQLARRLRELAGERRQALEGLTRRLAEQPGGEALAGRIADHLALWRRLQEGEELAAVQQFLYEAGPVSRFLAEAAELAALPERLERLLGEVGRLRHLFGQPPFSEGDWAGRMELPAAPPGLDRLEELDAWLQATRRLYREYRQAYREAHDAWWQALNRDPRWNWRPPELAASRHLHLEETLKALEEQRQEAYRLRCRGVSDLEFQTRCACGFDGHEAPAGRALERIGELRGRIETELTRFFAQERVKARVRDWIQAGGEVNEATQAYLRGEGALPGIADPDRFDRHLAGVETVRCIGPEELLEPLRNRVWEPAELEAALVHRLRGLKAERLRIEQPAADGDEPLLSWAVQQALGHALPLPQGVGATRAAAVAACLRTEWVQPAALARAGELGLGEPALRRLLGWLLDGTLPLPTTGVTCPAVAAAGEILRPTAPATPAALGRLAAALYRQHERFHALAGTRWPARLEALARVEPDPTPPELAAYLEREAGSDQWLVIDALGLPLLELLRRRVEHWLPHWRATDLAFARVTPPTHTARFFDDLAARTAGHPLEKLNALDRLLHRQPLPFADLERLADAELGASARAIQGRLDPARPLLLFADHGFRLAPDGAGYRHGGNSTLERVVPLLRMLPLDGTDQEGPPS